MPCKVIKLFFLLDSTSFSSASVAAPFLGLCSELYLHFAGGDGLLLCFPRVVLTLFNIFLFSGGIFVRGTQLPNLSNHQQALPMLLGHKWPSYSRTDTWRQLSPGNCSTFRSEYMPSFPTQVKCLTRKTEHQGKALPTSYLTYKDAATALHPKLTLELFLVTFIIFLCH